mmetsp:Transcript_20908/g.59706  ORF Transcript_20908/g.59706 Transcript_20908/m.59706 type:complete len:268 (-) Transcript_20908:484-1287(-)
MLQTRHPLLLPPIRGVDLPRLRAITDIEVTKGQRIDEGQGGVEINGCQCDRARRGGLVHLGLAEEVDALWAHGIARHAAAATDSPRFGGHADLRRGAKSKARRGRADAQPRVRHAHIGALLPHKRRRGDGAEGVRWQQQRALVARLRNVNRPGTLATNVAGNEVLLREVTKQSAVACHGRRQRQGEDLGIGGVEAHEQWQVGLIMHSERRRKQQHAVLRSFHRARRQKLRDEATVRHGHSTVVLQRQCERRFSVREAHDERRRKIGG